MKGLLKCYYGYQNWGDELLFFGVVKYIYDHNADLTHLDVEVGDVERMTRRCELNQSLWMPYKDRVSFVPSRTFAIWIADYDTIYVGGGEVLASATRDFWRSGINYLLLFWRWIYTGKVVWLGGIETPKGWRSKLLYRTVLPFAHEIVCREQGSYEIAKRYSDKVILYHDFAIDVMMLDKDLVQGECSENFDHNLNKNGIISKNYVIINFIPKHTTAAIIAQFHDWILDYPNHRIINIPAESGDVLPEEIVTQYTDRIQTRQRWEHEVGYINSVSPGGGTLAIFEQASAGFGQRLHFIIPCVYYGIEIFHTSYSEKVDKILRYFDTQL